MYYVCTYDIYVRIYMDKFYGICYLTMINMNNVRRFTPNHLVMLRISYQLTTNPIFIQLKTSYKYTVGSLQQHHFSPIVS